jgi:hypothetical protein
LRTTDFLRALDGLGEEGHNLVGRFDEIRIASAEPANLVQQLFVPVVPQAQGLDGDAVLACLFGEPETLGLIAIRLAVGEQQHLVDALGGELAVHLAQAEAEPPRHLRTTAGADALHPVVEVAALVGEGAAPGDDLGAIAKDGH